VFSETLLDHFQAPRNSGEMADADAQAEEENPVCGDRLHIWLRVRAGRIEEMTWRAQGCAPAIAAASLTSELVRGMTVEQARQVDRRMIADALGGLPARKSHAALLTVAALQRALGDFSGERDSQ
jgi:nitrogen fixation NifU-like protein